MDFRFPFPLSPERAGPGTLISYISLQPGAGASTLACLHANSLSHEVALIDFSPSAKVRAYVGITEDRSAASILGLKNISDEAEIYHASEKRDNVYIFPGVTKIANINLVNSQVHLKAVTSLKSEFKHSIAVLGGLNGPSWITAMLSDIVCVVVGPYRPDMDAFRENIDFLARLGCKNRLRIILNKAEHQQGIKIKDCISFFHPDFTIPYDEKIIRQGNVRNLVPKAVHTKVFSNLMFQDTSEQDAVDPYLIGALAAKDGLIAYEEIANIESKETRRDEFEDLISYDAYKELQTQVQEIVLRQFSNEDLDPVRSRNLVTRTKFNDIVVATLKANIPEPKVPLIANRLFNNILGYGPLEEYFMDPEVTEIFVNGTIIKVEKKNRKFDADQNFESISLAEDLLKRMISNTGRRIDQAEPRVNARLHDGSRLIGQIAPVASDGILITIRRFRQDINVDALITNKSASRDLIDFLKVAVEQRQNIVVAGGTGAGKTTWLNNLASFIPVDQSIITIEDPAELQLQHPDVRRLEARDANIEGKGRVTLAQLVTDALRMKPDRIILGECRAEEAIDMLQAMNTGHDGSLTTIHCNSAEHGIIRLVNMVEQAGMNIPHDAIMDQINDVIDLILFVKQDRKTGRKRLDHIIEIVGVKKALDGRTIDVLTNRLWQYDTSKDDWVWVGKNFSRQEKFEMGGWQW